MNQGAPTIVPREISRDPSTRRRSEPNSAEESHGEAGTGLLITQTTCYTNSQNEAYRNFNAYGSRGYMRNYKSYEGGTRNNGDRAGRSSGPSTVQTERRRPDVGDQEHRQAETGHIGTEEESNPTSRSHIFSQRNLIEVPRMSCPEELQPVDPPPSSLVQGPAVSTLQGHEIVESGGSNPNAKDVSGPVEDSSTPSASEGKSLTADMDNFINIEPVKNIEFAKAEESESTESISPELEPLLAHGMDASPPQERWRIPGRWSEDLDEWLLEHYTNEEPVTAALQQYIKKLMNLL